MLNAAKGGVLPVLYDNVWTEDERASLGVGEFNPQTSSQQTLVDNIDRLRPRDILNYLATHDVTGEHRRVLIGAYESKVLRLQVAEAAKLLANHRDTIDVVIDIPLQNRLNAIFNKSSCDLAEDAGHRMACLGCANFIDFIIETSLRNGDIGKLSRMVPSALISSFLQQVVQNLKSFGFESQKLFDLMLKMKQNGFLAAQTLSSSVFHPLAESYQKDFERHLWFFEKMDIFTEELSYATNEKLCDLVIRILDDIVRDMFRFSRGVRSLFQSICLKIRDDMALIDIAKYHWLTTCSLPRTKLPSPVFR